MGRNRGAQPLGNGDEVAAQVVEVLYFCTHFLQDWCGNGCEEGGMQVRTLRGHSGVVCVVDSSLDGKCVLSGSEDTLVKIWDIEVCTFVKVLYRWWGDR